MGQSVSPSGHTFRWAADDSEGSSWVLEIESDVFNETDGLVVSIYAEDAGRSDDGTPVSSETIITATPQQAREMAAALLKVAEHIERSVLTPRGWVER